MQKSFVKRLIVGWIAGACLLNGCVKPTPPAPQDVADVQSALDALTLEDEFHTLFDLGENVFRATGDEDSELPPCAKKFTIGAPFILFADSTATGEIDLKKPCLCKDGVYRRGRVYYETEGVYPKATSKLKLSFFEYFAGPRADSASLAKFFGALEATVTAFNADSAVYQIKVTDGGAVYADGTGPQTWTLDHKLVRYSGTLTVTPLDDKTRVTGTSAGVNRSGKAFTARVTNALEKDFTKCLVATGRGHFIKGKEIVKDDKTEALFNFDPDNKTTCDRIVRLSTLQLFKDMDVRNR